MAARSRKATHRNPASASSFASDKFDDTMGTDITGTTVFPASFRESMEKAQRVENLAKEYLKIQGKIAQLEARQKLGYLKPSRVGNSRDNMNAAALALHDAAKEAPDLQSKGSDIVVSSKECAKACTTMTKLLHGLTSSSKLKKKLDEDLTSTSLDPKQLQETEKLLREAADTVDEDVKQLQERIERLKRY